MTFSDIHLADEFTYYLLYLVLPLKLTFLGSYNEQLRFTERFLKIDVLVLRKGTAAAFGRP